MPNNPDVSLVFDADETKSVGFAAAELRKKNVREQPKKRLDSTMMQED